MKRISNQNKFKIRIFQKIPDEIMEKESMLSFTENWSYWRILWPK
jgi:hypothetical protein